jgi:FkbM family methyltransferase
MKSVARKVKALIRVLLGKDVYVRTDCACRTDRFGSAHGGWDIAVERINKDSCVYSFGVGEDVSFDLDLIARFGFRVHAFDPTPKSIRWVKAQVFPPQFTLHEYGLADFDGSIAFNPPENPDHVSHTILDRPSTCNRSITVPVRRLSTIMAELGHRRIDVLKMDIEGAEYGVIEDIARSHILPGQLLVEFHHRFPNVGVRKTKKAIKKLRGMGYRLFSVSDTGEELCFIHGSS